MISDRIVPTADTDLAELLDREPRDLPAALGELPARQREVLVLRFYANLSEAQIAATNGHQQKRGQGAYGTGYVRATGFIRAGPRG
jgi:DNA-directed RNA polymerase specialized sigma24 family protein